MSQVDPFDELFAGSEPVAPTPEDAQAAPEGEAQTPASPDQAAHEVQQYEATASPVPENFTAALLNLHERIQRLEEVARRNGWAL